MIREELNKLIDMEFDKLESTPSSSLYDLEVDVEHIKQKIPNSILQPQMGNSSDRRKKRY